MIKNRLDDPLEMRIAAIRERICDACRKSGRQPSEITLMAVTKTVAPERVNAALACGISCIGENRVQEFCEKLPQYRLQNTEIHFIGHLQTNKIRDIIGKVQMIESVDSVHLALALHQTLEKQGAKMPVLLQVNVGQEASKGGFFPEELPEAVRQIEKLSCLQLRGLMAIPPKGCGEQYFLEMDKLRWQLADFVSGRPLLSMGMSEDYERAICCGADIVRLGRAIFGERPPAADK